MIKAIIFDLDDTLYEERQFFQSGFAVVAEHLEQRGAGSRNEIAKLLNFFHHVESRHNVFQKLAIKLGFPEDWIPDIVSLFRSHFPRIEMAKEDRDVLVRLRLDRDLRLGCITDGWRDVQRRKISALNIEPLLDSIVVTDELGRVFWKPHPWPFQVCCTQLGVEAAEAVYIGDYPERDMVGANRAGLLSVRIRRPGSYFEKTDAATDETQPDYEINTLQQIETLLPGLGFSLL